MYCRRFFFIFYLLSALQVLFAASNNAFDEGSGINRIGVEIKSPIAQDITIDVFGGKRICTMYMYMYTIFRCIFHVHMSLSTVLIITTFLLITESMPTMGVAVSGSLVNTSVTFTAQGLTSAFFNIFISSDDIALENDEVYEIEFVSSFPSDGVELGLPTEVIIRDINSMLVFILFMDGH